MSEDKESTKYWLLYDDINAHVHLITNIRNFFCVKFCCEKCFRTFKCENTFKKHYKIISTVLK